MHISHQKIWAQGEDEEDEEEDEELQRHYKELEAIKQEEEEKNRQRVIAAEASSVDGGCEEGEEGDTWEDAAASDDLVDNAKSGDDAMGLKPIDHEKWQQRQVCIMSVFWSYSLDSVIQRKWLTTVVLVTL